MLRGTNLKHAKAYNFRTVLETIRLYGPISRANIARKTGLTAQTISNITREALHSGLVVEGEQQREGRGAPSTALYINPEGAFTIGLDLDKDHLTGVLVDLDGTVRRRLHTELLFPPPEEAFELMERMVLDLIALHGLSQEDIWGIGIGFPGPLSVNPDRQSTRTVNPKAFPGWQNIPVADIMKERLKIPIFLENNATAAAIGERRYGAGQHIETFFYLYLTVGLGGGLIINGQPLEGFQGNAGEVGYLPTEGPYEPVSGFRRPHVGQFFNLPLLYKKLAREGYEVGSPEALLPLYQVQAPGLMQWLEEGASHLAPILMAIEYILDPHAIFLGGRLPDELILDLMGRLETRLDQLRIADEPSKAALRKGTAGVDAAALGVATLPMNAFFAPLPRVLLKRRVETV